MKHHARGHHEELNAAPQIIGGLLLLVPIWWRPVGEKLKRIMGRDGAPRKD